MKSKQLTINGRNYIVFENGKIIGPSGKELKWFYDKDGYPRVGVGKTTRGVHTLVALAFVPNPHNYKEVDHIDGNRGNPSADNLEWVSHKENVRRAANRGSYSGERNSHAKLNRHSVSFIRFLAKRGMKRRVLASYFQVTKFAIDDIVTRRNWKHVD